MFTQPSDRRKPNRLRYRLARPEPKQRLTTFDARIEQHAHTRLSQLTKFSCSLVDRFPRPTSYGGGDHTFATTCCLRLISSAALR